MTAPVLYSRVCVCVCLCARACEIMKIVLKILMDLHVMIFLIYKVTSGMQCEPANYFQHQIMYLVWLVFFDSFAYSYK
jgi:hypothetical protein